jgi:CheY-like chemotaxis protein
MGGIMPKTLLLADDSVTIQKVVGISFANEDVRLVTVDNGDDALARARELVPDIVLADVVMPGMNGYEVCEAIKADPALRHVPVLLLTGTFEAYDEERAGRAGADGHVTKPFEAQALVDLVNARLAEAAAPAPAEAPAAAAQPAASESDGDFDLFEEVTAPSGVESAPAGEPDEDPAARTTALLGGDDALGVDDGREAFAFDAPDDVHDELSVTHPGPAGPGSAPETSHDATVALFDDADEADDAFANAETLPPVDAEAAPPDPFGATRVADLPGEESFATAAPATEEAAVGASWLDEPDEPVTAPPVGGEAFAAVGPDELGDAGLADPASARDYDVSSSDLGDPLAEPAAPPPSDPPAPEAFAPMAGPQTPATAPERPAPPTAPEAPAEAVGAAPVSAERPAGLPELSPAFRQEIQDTLEKVAWEAFGDVAEKLVRDTLERVEKVAWEVIPQMAETLIQEEIRRLKDDAED